MKNKYIINDVVIYNAEQHRLVPTGVRGKETVLNVPASRCLLLLLQQPGVSIHQQEFFSEVWEKHGQCVNANTFYQNISLIRKAIRNAGIRNSVIKTIPKVGLCFTGTVQVIEEESASAVCSEPKTDDTIQVIDTNSEKTAVKTQSLTFLKKIKGINVIVFSLFLFACIILLTSGQSQSARFFSTHTKIASENQCSIYIDRGELMSNYSQYVNFLSAKEVVCSPHEFIYIANISALSDTLILFCETSEEEKLKCSTRFKLADIKPAS